MKHFHHDEQKVAIDEQIIVKKRILERKFVVRTTMWCMRLHRADDCCDRMSVTCHDAKFDGIDEFFRQKAKIMVSERSQKPFPGSSPESAQSGVRKHVLGHFFCLFFTFFRNSRKFRQVWRNREIIVEIDGLMTIRCPDTNRNFMMYAIASSWWFLRWRSSSWSKKNILSTKVSSRMKI